MVRKYAGPLQPGKKSAYVKGTRKQYRRRRPTRITSRSVSKQTAVNRVVAKVMSKINETKVNELTPSIHTAPLPINSSVTFSNPTHVQGYVVGEKPASWSSGLVGGGVQYLDLKSFEFPPGTGSDERIGDYMYAKRTTAQLNIMMNANGDSNRVALPYRFRMVCFRPKTGVRTPGNPSDPTLDLFINSIGVNFGHGSSTSIEFNDLWQGILNKKDYYILQDKKFMLTAPGSKTKNDPGALSHHVNLTGPHSKDYLLRIPYNKKVRYDNATNKPEDLNMATGILIFAQAVGDYKANSELWETSIQGVTSFMDA